MLILMTLPATTMPILQLSTATTGWIQMRAMPVHLDKFYHMGFLFAAGVGAMFMLDLVGSSWQSMRALSEPQRSFLSRSVRP